MVRWHVEDGVSDLEIAHGYEIERFMEIAPGVRVLCKVDLAAWLAAMARKQGRNPISE